MADLTDPVDVPDTSPASADSEAPASRVGQQAEPLPGTDPMGAETGSLAGTSR